MTEPFPTHPRVVETMAVIGHALEQYDRVIEAQKNNSTTASDATKTVYVTVNHYRWLTDVWIAPGTTRSLNAPQMSARLREAVQNANELAQRSADALTADHQLQFEAVHASLRAVEAKYGHSGQGGGGDHDAGQPAGDRW